MAIVYPVCDDAHAALSRRPGSKLREQHVRQRSTNFPYSMWLTECASPTLPKFSALLSAANTHAMSRGRCGSSVRPQRAARHSPKRSQASHA